MVTRSKPSRVRSVPYAKLVPPTLPIVLQRTRLFRLLDKSNARRLIWITAPAGAGKTTLVASYLKSKRVPVLWYRLDESDADPSSFFHFLSLAAKSLAPRFKRPLPTLTPEYVLGLQTFARRYFQELGARLPRRCRIVLDNYHEVPADAALHQLLACGVYELPDGVSVVVMSRQGPCAPMARLMAEQLMDTIGPDPLRFSRLETVGVARLHLTSRKERVARSRIDELHKKAGGWAAGVTLLLDHIKHQETIESASAQESPESIFQFLATHAFEGLVREVQEVLLKTSILPDVSVTLAVGLTNSPKAGEVLRSLYLARHFIERRDEPEPWYRYHPLFRAFLLEQLATRYSVDEVRALRRQAAIRLAEIGHYEESIAQLRQAEDWTAMAGQIIALAPAVLGQGRLATVDDWIAAIPQHVLAGTPWLRFWHACSRLFKDPHDAHIMFEQVFAQFVAQNDQAGALLTWANVVRCILFQWRGLPRLDAWIARFRALHPEGTPYPSAEIEAQVAEAMASALVWRQPGNPETKNWLDKAIVLTDRLTGSGAGHAIFLTESYLVWMGNLAEARNGQVRLLERASTPGAAPSLKILYCLSEALLASIEARADDCRRAVREGLALAEREGIHLWDGWLVAQDIHNSLFAGDLNSAQRWLAEIRPMWERVGGLYRCQLCYLSAWSTLLDGDCATVMESGAKALSLAEQEAGPFPEALCCLLMASICQSFGQRQEAEAYRVRAEVIGEAMNSQFLRYGCLWLTAQCALESGDRRQCLQALRAALVIGRTCGLGGYVGWEAPVIARLCGMALEEGIEVSFVQGLIQRLWLPLAPELRPSNWPWPLKISMLGPCDVMVCGRPLDRQRKVPHRLLELLAAIVAFGGEAVPVARLTDALWPEADGDQAQENFKKSLARLRKMIGIENAILWQDGKITLNRDLCWVDALAFETLAKQADARVANTRRQDTGDIDKSALALYRGPFLGLEAIPEWAQPYQAELRRRWTRLLARRSDQSESMIGAQDMVRELEAAIDVDPVSEPLYQRLIPLLLAQGRRSEAVAQYDRCRAALARWGNRTPSVATDRLVTAMTRAEESA
ncbi:MAG TPA: BTAD domain-containing putative transcriptional regulator [Nitrospira sp.]|nr:BTAD domain-containing putative transcriptional regulator [Nitrospira sp.]